MLNNNPGIDITHYQLHVDLHVHMYTDVSISITTRDYIKHYY